MYRVMRTCFLLSIEQQQQQQCLYRHLSTGTVLTKDNPEWKAMKSAEKARRDHRWDHMRKSNPFVRNVGLASRMKALNLDPDDPALTNLEFDPDPNPDHLLHEISERTKRWEKQIHRRQSDYMDKEGLSRILTKKRFFKEKSSPNLLTWMEKQTIRHLHKTDPGLWTTSRLADGFPATVEIITKILKSKGFVHPDKISSHDEEVRSNWQLLLEGKLEGVDERLRSHLREHSEDQKSRLEKLLPNNLRSQVELEVAESYRKSLERPKLKAGEVGNIIVSYRQKLEAKEELLAKKEGAVVALPEEDKGREFRVKEVFSQDAEFDPEFEGPSPYRDTGLLNTGVDLRREKPMTMDQFKRAHVKGLTSPSFSGMIEGQKEEDSVKERYLEWTEEEMRKDGKTVKPKKLSVDKILQEVNSSSSSRAAVDNRVGGKPGKKETRVEEDVESEEVLLKIDIPEGKCKKGKLFKVKDSYYDDEGNFLYRIPTETMQVHK